MTYRDLVALIAKDTDLTQEEVRSVVRSLRHHTSEALVLGDRVTIRGLAAFYVRDTGWKFRHNPHTGRKEKVPPARRVRIRPSDALLNRVKERAKLTGYL